jgi:hypothetical protein
MKLRKKDGSVQRYGIPLFTLVVAFIVIMQFITYSSDINRKDKIDITAREYLLRIETEGHLTAEDETQLISDLQALGMSNISLTGTTLAKAGYGNKVTIVISGELEIADYNTNSLFSVDKTNKLLNISITKSSTAKY